MAHKFDQLNFSAHTCDALAFTHAFLSWIPDPKQAAVLSANSRRVILNCARQWGKTTVAATKIIHVAVTRPFSIVLIVAENLKQTAWVFQKIDRFLSELGIIPRREKHSRHLPNGSMILGIAAREEAVRSYTADFVFIDEAARIEDDVIDALEPAIAIRKGEWWMASTPRGRRGRFFEAWVYGEGPDLLKVCVPASQNPRIDSQFVERVRREKGDDYAKQEFECEFIENGTNLMSLDHIDNLEIRKS